MTGQQGTQGSAGMAASSSDIRTLQQSLKDKGLDPGPVNGVMNPKTQDALKTFQQRQGLNATGRLDAQTQTLLGIGQTGAPRAGSGPSTGTSIEPAMPRDPSVRPGEPLPPETPSLGARSPGTSQSPGGASTGTGSESGLSGGAGGTGATGNSGATGGGSVGGGGAAGAGGAAGGGAGGK